MALTRGEELRIELQVATHKLFVAVMIVEQTLQTQKTTPEERASLRADVEKAGRRRDEVIAKVNDSPEGW